MSASEPEATRRAELVGNLAAVRARIAAACERAGRSPSEITLIAVTKTFPASDVELLAELGVRDVGENRDQEAASKIAQLGQFGPVADGPVAGLRWHFIGALQTNKCASVARYAHVVHSVDRRRLVVALSEAAVRAGRTIECLVQMNLDPERRAERAGAARDDVVTLADAIAGAPGLTLRGMMGIAPLDGDPARAFADLGEAAARLRRAHPEAAVISAGMSGDFEVAIAHGATHLRVGAALLGSRPQPR